MFHHPVTALPGATLLLALTVLLGASPARAEKMSIEDLEALAEQKAWGELVAHLGDITPAKRKTAWQAVAVQGAVGHLTALAAGEDPAAGFSMADELGKSYPTLLKSPDFLKARAEVGLAGMGACYDRGYGGDCNERIRKFVELDKGNVALALQAGEIVARGGGAQAAFWLFKLAADAGKPDEVCKVERLAQVLTAALGQPTTYDAVKPAQQVTDKCWAFQKEAILDAIAESPTGYTATNACAVVKTKKDAPALALAVCKDVQK